MSRAEEELRQPSENAMPTPEERTPQNLGEEWCFGMIIGLPAAIILPDIDRQLPIPIHIPREACTLFGQNTEEVVGELKRDSRRILDVLQNDLALQTFVDQSPRHRDQVLRQSIKESRKPSQGRPNSCLDLYIVLYGPAAAFENVGIFAAKCNLFLQHPKYCDRNVPYRNPQCLSPVEDKAIYTYELTECLATPDSYTNALANPIDLFADTMGQEGLAEADSPLDLHTNLYKHQRQALTFMLQREEGWALGGHHKDIWKEERDLAGRPTYINTITSRRQTRPPLSFRGGLLIDAPGLGKSLSIIALIAADLRRASLAGHGKGANSTTLLVVPKTLIQTWRDELQKHLQSPSNFEYCVYYGKDRSKFLERLQDYALIITTYSIVRIDWKASLGKSEVCRNLYGTVWNRVVLDEAHIIREPSKSFAKSVCALQADRRWAVTGTPIQNRLMDLFSLFQFLRSYPFNDRKVFDLEVTEKWKARSDPESVAKLKTLVNCLSLRRPKETIDLPSRDDRTILVDFSDVERCHYEKVKDGTLHRIDSANQGKPGATFLNALKWVNELRLVCNHGVANRHTIKTFEQEPVAEVGWGKPEAQDNFDRLDQAGLAKCSKCGQDLASTMTDEDHCDEPSISETLELLCSFCVGCEGESAARLIKVCNHLPRCSARAPTTIDCSQDSGKDFTIRHGQTLLARGYTPSKIKRVVQDLVDSPGTVKSVVFSFWTKTFDILQPHLWAKSIRCVRLDGTLSASGRASVLRTFRSNPDIKVLLATISCGGIGLDLTAASRAYIMEPQWNPMSESQALDRIHRLGQLKEVVTTRYVIRNSFEEQVLALQRRKQELADLTLNSGSIKKDDRTRHLLGYLKQLVG